MATVTDKIAPSPRTTETTAEAGRVVERRPEREVTEERGVPEMVGQGGSMVESLSGLGALVLAILGLAGVMPNYMLPIGVILLGVALLFHGTAAVARVSAFHATAGRNLAGGSVGPEILGGLAGIVLGVLALVGISPLILSACAIIVLGASLILGSFSTMGLVTERRGGFEFGQEAAAGAGGSSVLVGLAGIVLGILALVGINAMTLNLVAVLALGAATLISGAAIGGRMIAMSR